MDSVMRMSTDYLNKCHLFLPFEQFATIFWVVADIEFTIKYTASSEQSGFA